jgi:uncharacterized protein YccT (UPF0319 family)
VVLALAVEADELQQQDAARVATYATAAERYLQECHTASVTELPLREAHARMCRIAEGLLPPHVESQA